MEPSECPNCRNRSTLTQWIISLAVSIVSCATLFIIFASYIINLHDTQNLNTVRIEFLQERVNQLSTEYYFNHRAPVPNGAGSAVGSPPSAIHPVPANGTSASPAVTPVPASPMAPAEKINPPLQPAKP